MNNIKDYNTYINENKQERKMYHYFYKIENNINKHFYYGIHSTYNIDDGYMGSGVALHEAYDEFGIENFNKQILKYFNTRQELLDYERKIVTCILVKNENCYNKTIGGGGHPHTNELVTVTDGKKNFVVSIDDERYKSGKLKGVTIGRAHYIDNDGKIICITPEEAKRRGLKGNVSGKICARKIGSNDRFKLIPVSDFDTSIYETPTTGKVTVKDKKGNIYQVSKNDERYISGELTPIWLGRSHKLETKIKMSNTHKKNKDQQGEKNSQYGTTWVVNIETGEDKKISYISVSELINNYFKKGFVPGRSSSKWIKDHKGEYPRRVGDSSKKRTEAQKIYNQWIKGET